MPLKLLAVGDLHLGRRPSRLPDGLVERASALGPAGAWERLVNAAIERRVDAIALAGDLVEREQDFFEGYRLLRSGIERLTAARIRVLGIAGNHDGAILPRLADEIPRFELLGRGGNWQAAALESGNERATLWGWSFPTPRVHDSPLSGAPFDRGDGPNLGLLHCDRDQTGSRYAPVSSRALSNAGLDAWLLGHIHQPDRLTAVDPGNYVGGYLGSVTGMDPGESGARGPWLLTIDGGRIAAIEQWPLAPLRWEPLAIDVEDMTDAGEARTRLLENIRELDASLASAPWQPDAIGLRVRFTGRTRVRQADIESLFPDDERAHIHDGERARYFIERVTVATLPEQPLDQLAERGDPIGLLAQRLQLLDRPHDDPARIELIQAARARLGQTARDGRWQALETDPDDTAIADWLRRAALIALEQWQAQRATP